MIETSKYARRTFYVDAVQVTEENMEEVAKWCMGTIQTQARPGAEEETYIKVRVHRPMTERQTTAFASDWILYAGTGFKVYTDRAFQKSFEKVKTLTYEQAQVAGVHPPIEPKRATPAVMAQPRRTDIPVEDVPPLDSKSGELQAAQDVVFGDDEEDVNYRDAKTGQFVTEEYAEKNPDTTVAEEADPAEELLKEVFGNEDEETED